MYTDNSNMSQATRNLKINNGCRDPHELKLIDKYNKSNKQDFLDELDCEKVLDVLYFTPNYLLNDEEFMEKAIKKDPRSAIQYASDRLKNDKKFCLRMSDQIGSNLGHLSNELCDDYDIVLKVVSNKGYGLMHASAELKKNKTIAMAAVRNHGLALKYVSDELKEDRDIVIIALQEMNCLNDGWCDDAIEFVSDKLKNDFEIGMIAVGINGKRLEYLHKDLQNNDDIVMKAIKQNGSALRYASERFKDIKEHAMISGCGLEYLSERLRADKDIILNALKFELYNVKYIPVEILEDKEFVCEMIEAYGDIFLLQHINGGKFTGKDFNSFNVKKQRLITKYEIGLDDRNYKKVFDRVKYGLYSEPVEIRYKDNIVISTEKWKDEFTKNEYDDELYEVIIPDDANVYVRDWRTIFTDAALINNLI